MVAMVIALFIAVQPAPTTRLVVHDLNTGQVIATCALDSAGEITEFRIGKIILKVPR